MLPSWCYLIIFILGIFSSNQEHKKKLSIIFLSYFVLMIALGSIGIESVVFYSFIRLIAHFLFLTIIALIFKCPKEFTKIYVFFGLMTVVEVLFSFGLLFDQLQPINYSILLSHICLDGYCAVIGINNWGTIRQAVMGSSIGLFYVFHFIGLI